MDKKTDFSFMKTGSDLTDDGLTTDYKQTVVSMLTLFCENALNGGALYTKHANRKGITPEDIKRAMMLEVFVYTKRPDTLAQASRTSQAPRMSSWSVTATTSRSVCS